MNQILIPTDYSTVADNALAYAIELAKHYKLDILLYHVVQLSTPDIANIVYVDAMSGLIKDAEKKMEEKAQALNNQYPEIKFTSKVEPGLLLDSLMTICEETNPVMVMMGITGTGTGLDKLIGSNATTAMNTLKYPVMIIPKNASFKPIDKICFACDLKNVVNSVPLLSIKAFAKLFNASVHILNVDYKNKNMTGYSLDEYNTLNAMLDDVKHEFHFIENEFVQDAIDDFTVKNEMSLLIMVPKKHSFVASLFHKSQSKVMAYQSHIPILSLHQD